MDTASAVTFAALAAALYAAHTVGDHWVQTDHQAAHKGRAGWAGRLACARHVTTHTAVCALAVTAAAALFGLTLTLPGCLLAVTLHTVTHYAADRRTPLRRLALAVGLRRLVTLGVPREGRNDLPTLGTGLYALDQAWHHLWLIVAAAILATI